MMPVVPVAALILGILGTVFSLVPMLFFLGVALSSAGLVIAALARRRLMAEGAPTLVATTGLVLSTIGFVLGLAMWATCAAVVRRSGDVRHAADPKASQEFERVFQKALEPSPRPDAAHAP